MQSPLSPTKRVRKGAFCAISAGHPALLFKTELLHTAHRHDFFVSDRNTIVSLYTQSQYAVSQPVLAGEVQWTFLKRCLPGAAYVNSRLSL
ncbi:hypothetical protein KM92DES2_10021 [uncultured Desulfovibrio sp.]|uniref:Uncharacterized protein n=1 Tax=uncultured Desulfovibrio sp. TaxID=167968 RepID=A0A212ITR4_9BACT|nr:hypothetical protein KM92DES2_10021 [uncultured Desulfovibrio sp.]